MSQDFQTHNLISAFRFPLNDRQWQEKLPVAVVVAWAGFLIPLIPGIFLAGYMVRLIQQTLRQEGETTLPGWENPGRAFTQGFKVSLAAVVYFLPVLILYLVAFGISLLPAFIAPSLAGFGAPEGVVSALGTAVWLIAAVIRFLAWALGLVIFLSAPVALVHLAAKDRFSAAFRLGEWWPIFRANFGGFLFIYVLMAGVAIFASFAVQFLVFTIVLIFLVPFALAAIYVYLLCVGSVLVAEAYRLGGQRVAEKEYGILPGSSHDEQGAQE